MNLSQRILLRTLILAVALPVLPLLAQEQPKEKKAEDEKKPKVTEEMVVTARKREETVQSVPISVAAPTESELRDRGAENIEDVAANVANFTVQNLGPGQSQVAIRGVSAGQIVRDQPGVKENVGVYLDESVISLSLFTPDVDLFDLSRVEVLRGPQGTLFGSGSEAGTIRYITNQPKLNTSETIGELGVNVFTDGGKGGEVKVATNAPFGSTAALRFVGYYTLYGGFIDATQPNLQVVQNVNDGYRNGARVSVLYQPSQGLSITPRLVYQYVRMNGWNRVDLYNILGNPYTTTRPQVQLGNDRQFTQIEEPFTDRFGLGDVTVNYDIGGGRTLSSITSYTRRNIVVVRDAGALTSSITGGSIGLPANIYTLNAPLFDRTKANVFTEEARVAGTSGKTQWVAGGFYSHMNRHYGQDLPVIGFTKLSGIPTKGIDAPEDSLFWSDLVYHFHQYALFGEATYSVSDRLDVTGGLRFYDFKEDRAQTFDGIFGNDNNGTSLVQQPGSTKANGIAPRVMLNYKLSDTTRLNAQISKGFRLGGINDPLNVPLCTATDLATYGGHNSWKDETLWNYEVGSKSTLMGGKGSFNASVFYADISDLQATVTAGSCSSRVIFNVPKARSTGGEFEFTAAPNDRFDFAISASHTDSKIRSTIASAGIQSGMRMATVPRDQASAAATLHWPMNNGMAGYLTGVWQHVGDRYTQILDQAAGFGVVNLNSFAPHNIGGPYTQSTFTFNPLMPSYDIVNARLGLLHGRWDTAFFVNNLTNERAELALDQERGTRARVGFLTNNPRQVGVSTRVTF